MNKTAQYIKNRLSLRYPQEESLKILVDIADKLTLKKSAPFDIELEKVRALNPICTDFERNFPSITFALATGVGKTRLMGAFITYLYIEKKIRNFFILAPNITVYNKLLDDFERINSPKYVFQGISEFVHNSPRIITGDNYTNGGQRLLFDSKDINIFMFNVSKIDKTDKGTNIPKIKRLSEYIGDSYFNYLCSLPDLVLLMDESHHYRAESGMNVINELNPVLGLELTATPITAGNYQKFKNVVYEYSLSKAIKDGFVKEPAIATRRDFNPSQYSPEDIDRIKLEDGIRIHEDTKVAIDIYTRDNNLKPIKPFVLVVAKDTTHSGELKELIMSDRFFDGYYKDKVMEIHSNQKGEEKDEVIEKLLSLENPDNEIEIVIHVNKLKEGWDVTNLYTIIPLRTAASIILREQTIGRGLRLPLGIKSGVDKVDKLTIIAHDKFQEIIDEANKPDSIIKQENIIDITEISYEGRKDIIISSNNLQNRIIEKQKENNLITDENKKQKADIEISAELTLITTLPELNKSINNISELKNEDIKKIVIEKARERLNNEPQKSLFINEIIKEMELSYDKVVSDFTKNIIEIPRILILQSNDIKAGFKDFNLDTKNLNFHPVSEEILIRKLREQENNTDYINGSGGFRIDKPENIIVNELINYPEIDYDTQSDLLYKLVSQTIDKFSSYIKEELKILNVVQYNKKEIGKYIYLQMMNNFYYENPSFEKPRIYPFDKIIEHNYSKLAKDKIYHYTDTIEHTNTIPSKIFSGFRKACHTFYKFDSKTEKDFSGLLENDKDVLKWLRPAPNQFKIYWNHNIQQYIPDFVVETKNVIYMIETKKGIDINTPDVQDKTKSALEYCKYATDFTKENNGKSWEYVLIPHNEVVSNYSFDNLVSRFKVNNQ